MTSVDSLFEVVYGVNLELINCVTASKDDGIPFVARTSQNNGVVAYVEELEDVIPNPAHTISVAGSGSVLSCFYQDRTYYSGRDLFYLKPRIEMTVNQMLFYCYAISLNAYKYSYGRQANKTLKDILIPSLNEIPVEIAAFNLPIPKSKHLNAADYHLNTEGWKYFKMSKIFHLEKCKCSSALELLNEGDEIHYIGAKKNENGVMGKVMREEELITKGNCIVFIGDGQGSIGYSIYQPNDFIGSTTLTCGYNERLNKYNALFIVTVLDLERFRYSFGRKYGKTQVGKSEIKLPTKDGNEPDFDFMENYIKCMPYAAFI